MSDPADHPAPASAKAPGGERPINLILPIVTAIVGFVIGFLLSDISKNLATSHELPTPKDISHLPPTAGDRDARPDAATDVAEPDEAAEDVVDETADTPS
ncbi:MAG: hypothetical protein KDA20_00740 [Phycisphaerales bacterium]|nr:hypothetical protein [Phycisphaerales bacterium]